jgi:uncharacterized protein with FMN-binding domain
MNKGKYMEKSSKKDLIVTLAVLLVIVFIVTSVVVTKKDPAVTNIVSTKDTAPAATLSPAPSLTAATPTTATSGYKDGNYNASGKYSTPEGSETINVSVTLKDGVVTDTSATENPKSSDSQEYVTMFLENYKELVVGNNIAELKLSRVSGSSLTSQGFNSAIQTIITQAKV